MMVPKSIFICIHYINHSHVLLDSDDNMVYVEATVTLRPKPMNSESEDNILAILAVQVGNKLTLVDHMNYRITDTILMEMNADEQVPPKEAYLGVGMTSH